MSAQPSSPVRLEGRLDTDLSRWLWVVKWLLAIPHFIVLAFLWIAFFVLSVVAFFAILFTTRYPKGIFDFNVGVLRWTWRVGYYSYAALGTDRYPPFTLGPAADYPATLDIDYPDRLSRGLVLVKWWLLAIPQYLLVGVFLGGGGYVATRAGGWHWGGGVGLITLLVLFAAISLLFRGIYPLGIYDVVLGLDRWVARVAAYAGLMTDSYPPFRLDQGGEEPGLRGAGEAPLSPSSAAETVEAQAPPAEGGGAGRIVLLVLGCIAALLALALLIGGCATIAVDRTQRDDDGFVMSPTEDFATATYAISSESADIDVDAPDWVLEDLVGTIRIRSESDRPVFVGIARSGEIARYLGGVDHVVVAELGREPRYSGRPGGAPDGPPGEQTFWAASSTGAGEQTLDWKPEEGSWSAVLMNVDASRGVAADLSIGAELGALTWVGPVLLVAGGLLAVGAALMITFGVRRGRR
jgi:Domain of unknown function (DUF4389)